MTRKRSPDPPEKWLKPASKFWREVHRSYQIDEPQAVAPLLTAACQQLHRAAQARVVLDREGVTVEDRFHQVKPHPMLDGERQAHLAFMRLARELGLDIELPSETRGHRRPGTET